MAFHFSKITPNLDKMQYGPHNLPASPTALIWYGWKILLFRAKFQNRHTCGKIRSPSGNDLLPTCKTTFSLQQN